MSLTLERPARSNAPAKEGTTAICLLSISGPSGAGKTTLVKQLIEGSGGVFIPAPSITTRASRESDLLGEYFHISPTLFRSLIEKKRFAWYLEAHGNMYGTEKSIITEACVFNITNTSVFNITPETVKVLREFLAGIGPQALALHRPVYVLSPPADELRRRITLRGGLAENEIERRIADCLDWDKTARAAAATGEIPYSFIRNDGRDDDIAKPLADLKRSLNR